MKEETSRYTSTTMKERFNRLATLKLNSVLDFIEPSELERLLFQIEQLFAPDENPTFVQD